MLQECPHSWEKMGKGKAYIAEDSEEESFFTMSNKIYGSRKEEENDIILYTGNNKEKIVCLGSETLGRLLLDCGCTRNVCGEEWWWDFYENLSEEDKAKVKMEDSGKKKFRFYQQSDRYSSQPRWRERG